MRANMCSNSPLWLLKVEILNCWPGLQSIKSCTSFLNCSRVIVLCKVPAWSCRCNSVWKSSSSLSSESNSSLSSSSRSSLWWKWGSSSVWKSSLQCWLVLVRVMVIVLFTLGLGYRLCFVDVLGYCQNQQQLPSERRWWSTCTKCGLTLRLCFRRQTLKVRQPIKMKVLCPITKQYGRSYTRLCLLMSWRIPNLYTFPFWIGLCQDWQQMVACPSYPTRVVASLSRFSSYDVIV